MAVSVKNLSYVYMPKTPYETRALDGVTFDVNEGDFVGVIGATGSGKSTLVQHLNGLIRLTSGDLKVFDIDLAAKRPDLRRLRGLVGMVFQYPEYQLFDETVFRDVAFGPKNMKLSEEEINTRVKNAIELVGLDFEEIKDRSPFDLSGGQKRRVAIAGVLAMRPQILVLDEPTAGLDPVGRREMYELVLKLKRECSPTVIMISHNMDEISRYASRLLVLSGGKLIYDMPPKPLFNNHYDDLVKMGLDIPVPVKLAKALKDGGVDLGDVVTPSEFVEAFTRRCGK